MSRRPLLLLLALLGLAFVLMAADCSEEPEEGANPADCSDGADNDGDGDFDCNDSGCAGSDACTGTDDDDVVVDDDDVVVNDDDATNDDDSADDDDDSGGPALSVTVTEAAGLPVPTADGWTVIVGFWTEANWNDETGCPAGEAAGDFDQGVWDGGYEASLEVPPGNYILMAVTHDPAEKLFEPNATNQGFAQRAVVTPEDEFSIELTRTLGDECQRGGER